MHYLSKQPRDLKSSLFIFGSDINPSNGKQLSYAYSTVINLRNISINMSLRISEDLYNKI